LEVPDEKLDDIQGKERDKAKQPDDSSPTPTNTANVGESPIRIHSNERCNLQKKQQYNRKSPSQ